MQEHSNAIIAFVSSLLTAIGVVVLALYKDSRTNVRIDEVEKKTHSEYEKLETNYQKHTEMVRTEYPTTRLMRQSLSAITQSITDIRSDLKDIKSTLDDQKNKRIQQLEDEREKLLNSLHKKNDDI